MDAVDIDTSEPQPNDEDIGDSAVHVCRVCLLDNVMMRDLFADEDVALSTKAMSFANVKVLPGDGLPGQVCCECADKLESAYEFKLQVEQADSVLRERYDTLNIKHELFFNEVEVHLEGERGDETSELDDRCQYETSTGELDNEIDSHKADSLLKDQLALLQVEAESQQHVLAHEISQEDQAIQEHILQNEEQYIQATVVNADSQILGEEMESEECDAEQIKAEAMQGQESMNIEEHNYMVQQEDYALTSEHDQELLNEGNVVADNHAEYLSLIGGQVMAAKENEENSTALSVEQSECAVDENCEQDENQESSKIDHTMTSQNSVSEHVSDEENYFENLNLSSRLTQYQVEKSDKILFMCYFCDKQFMSKGVLKEHMHSHEEVRKTLSLKKTPEKSQKNTPAAQKTPPPSGKKPNKCPYCGKEYLYVISFNKHVKQHQKNDDVMDSSIQMEDSMESDDFDNSDTFEIISISKEGSQIEEETEKNEDSSLNRKRRRIEIYPCDKCSDLFPSKQELKKHLLQSHIIHKCTICNQEFDSLEKLRNHRTTHVLEGVISDQDLKDELADFCNELQIKNDSSHENAINQGIQSDMKKELKCQTCHLTFNSKKTLLKHLATHDLIRYRCKICGDEFTEKDQLQKHAELHAQAKSFQCTQCTRMFSNELTLRNHLIATNHKTMVRGEEYDTNKRIKRVAAKAAQKIIDKINTEDGSEDFEKDEDHDEYSVDEMRSERHQGSSKKVGGKRDLDCGICDKKCISKQALAKHMDYHMSLERGEQSEKVQKNTDPKDNPGNCRTRFGDDRDDDDDDDGFDGGLDWPMDTHECSTCKKKYSTKKSLLRHQLLHEEPNFECDICNVKFYRKDKLKAHYDKCSEKNPDQVRRCNICGDIFENNEILREHRTMHVDEGILTEEDLRDLEPGSEDRRQADKSPRKRRTDITGLECPECNKHYTSRKGLLRHIQVHEGKKYLCDICPKKFYRREHLKIHVAKHNMVKPYKCTRCSKRFIKEEQLATHLTKHDKSFKKNKESDSSAKRWLCEICSKSFTQSTTLVAHLRAHKGIKPYVCDVCARPFTTNAYLKMHMRTHTHERPYTCQYCGRAFARADTLANHLTSHTGEAKYHCKHCPKNFRRLKSLKEHVYIHTGQRPYACPTCDRKFNNNGSRYAHSKRCKQNLLQNQSRPNPSQAPVVVEQQQGILHPIRLAPNLGPTMQVIQSKNIKTITITRPDEVSGHQLMQHQEILMPLILPLTVTLTDVDTEVILPEGTKLYTPT